ncbi:MAG: hypothetical protein ABSA45_06655, partial [Verrucomicrobiota bacterium]
TGERLESAVGLRNRFQAAVVHAFSYTNPLPQLPPQKLRCAPHCHPLRYFHVACCRTVRDVNTEAGFRSRLFRQYFEISFVALCSQSSSDTSRIISTAANHFGAFGAGSPSGVSLPTAIRG